MVSVIGNNPHSVASLKPKPLVDLVDDYSLIMNEKARTHHWQGEGPLSLKIVLKGEAVYKVENRIVTIDEKRLLVLNDRQDYSITVDNKFETETFIVFFDRNLIDAVTCDHYFTSIEKLDDPFLNCKGQIQFTPYSKEITPEVLSAVRCLIPDASPIDHQQTNERLYNLFQKVLELQLSHNDKKNSLEFEKKSTRHEMAKRVLMARDFLHSNLGASITLDDLSRNSALSKNHLLRTFKQYFGKTPFQYLSEIRLQKAKKLLTHPDTPISEICAAVGLESLSSFSWAFRKQTGLSPTEFQKQAKN